MEANASTNKDAFRYGVTMVTRAGNELEGDNGHSLGGDVPDEEEVIVVSGFFCREGERVPRYVEIAKRNHMGYCKRNGYLYKFYSDYDEGLRSETKSSFYKGCNSKPMYLTRALAGKPNAIAMWIDIDSLFMTYRRIETLVSDGSAMCVAGDCSDYINSGHIVVRGDVHGLKILSRWRAIMDLQFRKERSDDLPFQITDDGFIEGDQTALVAVVGGAAENEESVRKAFNSLNLYSGNEHRLHRDRKAANCFTEDGLVFGQDIASKYWGRKIRLMTQRSMNSYVIGPLGGLYRPGDWIIHFVGKSRDMIEDECIWNENKMVPGEKGLGLRFWVKVTINAIEGQLRMVARRLVRLIGRD